MAKNAAYPRSSRPAIPITTFRPIARRTKTPAFANASYHVPGDWTKLNGGYWGRTYIAAVRSAIAATIVSERWASAQSRRLVRRDGEGVAGRATAVMRGLQSAGRTGRT